MDCRPVAAVLAYITVVAFLGSSGSGESAAPVHAGVAGQSAMVPSAESSAILKVTIVGSGGGPAVNVQRFGPSILVDAADQLLLFDAGRGATIRLAQLGIPLERVDKVFLTHLHSDHVIALPDLFLTPWASTAARRTPFEVW